MKVIYNIPDNVSPFIADESEDFSGITEPPNLCMAAANEQNVRVLASKNMEPIIRPYCIKHSKIAIDANVDPSV